jgi:cyclopropane-fatty-acyl-phospholipid synthase
MNRRVEPAHCPALSEVLPAIEQSWLWASDIEILRLHYAYTLEHWYERLRAHQAQIAALYDERFFRLWSFYLASAIMSFRHDGHCN